MTQADAIYIAREALMMVVILAAPGLLVAMFIGLCVGIFQATTQIQEQTLAFVPKLLGVFLTLILLAGWLMTVATSFATKLYSMIPNIMR